MSLELFEQLKNPTPDNEAIRSEIRSALPTLECLKEASQIAERGLNLVLPLLADEQRLQNEVVTDKKGKRKVSSTILPILYHSIEAHTPATIDQIDLYDYAHFDKGTYIYST
jgi:hypothetical protein